MGRPFSPRDRDRRSLEPRIRINDGITASEIRLIDENGAQAGIKTLRQALDYATECNLDLLRPKVGIHDYETKKGHVLRFLQHKDKVKVTIMFRGRELVHPERGEALLMRLAEDVKEFGVIESTPNLDGRNMIMMMAPVK
jgi:translation initiation factor IF-3